jgi:hypothetical protein
MTSSSAFAKSAPKIAHVRQLISTLFYGEEQAAQVSYSAHGAYDYSHDYPGSYNRTKFLKAVAINHSKYCSSIDAPQLTTVMPDPSWVGPAANPAEHGSYLFAGKKPRGFTYILDVNYSCATGGSNAIGQVHVTILKDKAYFYFGP